MQIAVDGNNFFHTGWLARMLSLPRVHPRAAALKEADVKAFDDGWDTCNQTPIGDRLQAFYDMLWLKQAVAVWIDDEGEALPLT